MFFRLCLGEMHSGGASSISLVVQRSAKGALGWGIYNLRTKTLSYDLAAV
jgi:hypothetical protein